MKLEKLKIEGFRKILNSEVIFGDASFLIGSNNVGKSSVFEAIRLITTNGTPTKEDFTSEYNEFTKLNNPIVDKITLEATFSNLPPESSSWIGFGGRVFLEDGKLKIRYKKEFSLSGGTKYWMFEKEKDLNQIFMIGSKITKSSILAGGIEKDLIDQHFQGIDENQNLGVKAYSGLLDSFVDVWTFREDFIWTENPGGIPQNVISKMPKLILIPAEHKSDEMNPTKTSALGEVMSTIFGDVLEDSPNYDKVKSYYTELAKEVDTDQDGTEFSKLMTEVNSTINGIFPEAKLYAKVNLNDPSTFLKPTYDIRLGSNIMTGVTYQGTGMIRSTAFSLLKYREEWRKKRESDIRNVIICFEEPELFLHPNAANLMRDTIYELASDANQIVCTSHSPYMIDLSRNKERQIINLLTSTHSGVSIIPFNVTDEYTKLTENDKQYVKMLLKIDDTVARIFFSKRVVIVEGDTEEIIIKKTIELLPKETRQKLLAEMQLVKARGKGAIISFVKYLKALGVSDIFVVHDLDTGTMGAEVFNTPISETLDNDTNKFEALANCIEDMLGYTPPTSEKPYAAFKYADKWHSYDDVPEKWKKVFEKAFAQHIQCPV